MNIETTQGTLKLILLQHEGGGDVMIYFSRLTISEGRSGEQMEILPRASMNNDHSLPINFVGDSGK